jgi:hypothetical protein
MTLKEWYAATPEEKKAWMRETFAGGDWLSLKEVEDILMREERRQKTVDFWRNDVARRMRRQAL